MRKMSDLYAIEVFFNINEDLPGHHLHDSLAILCNNYEVLAGPPVCVQYVIDGIDGTFQLHNVSSVRPCIEAINV